ncbi:hypothetical protein ABEB36_009860 [Hypothenemus hampei]|uniref:SAM domain-containing protein n=1 Tax=Hypothenemus hampei TaxID=57062 RepID=A0ABD1ELT6_HYPHA
MSANMPSEKSEVLIPEDSSMLKDNKSAQIVIENSSDDIVISKCDQIQNLTQHTDVPGSLNTVPLKAQVLPLVYIKNNKSKLPFAINTAKANNNSNNISTTSTTILHRTNASVSTISLNNNQNLIFAGRGKSLMLPKQPIALMSQGKMAGTYVTMLKQVTKPSELQMFLQTDVCQSEETDSLTTKLQTTTATQPQKFILAAPISKLTGTNNAIGPMPKIQSNRPSATATTNSLQSAKFAVLPMPVPQKETGSQNNQKVFNFQIADGKIFSNVNSPVTIMYDNNNKPEPLLLNSSVTEIIPEKSACDKKEEQTTINAEKNDISSKSYELSIAEEESLSNQSDNNKLVVTSADSNSSGENIAVNKQKQSVGKFTHGISILKKNFSNNLLPDQKTVCNNSKNISESDVTSVKPSNGLEEKIVVTLPDTATVKKPEREKNRRKSQFNYRKDFDDMDVTFFQGDETIKEETVKEEKEDIIKSEADVNQELVSPTIDPKTLFDLKLSELDAFKFITWDDNIGHLPGSDLKFLLNEFGIIEFISEEDHEKILEKRQRKVKEKEDLEREIQCVICGCYGIRADFINTSYCSFDCQATAKQSIVKRSVVESIAFMDKRQKRSLVKSKSDNDIGKEVNSISADDDTSNETIQDKFSYPWACKKKGFSWSKYLIHINAKSAPVKLFKDPFPYNRNGFKPGMKLEGVDPQHPSYFCVLTVVDTVGYRIRLHFDGYPDNYDFWTNADSMDIFPSGWCEKHGHTLRPPRGYDDEEFNWMNYLKTTKSTAAPKHLFVNRAGQAICPNGFRIGMKLEAVDKKNTSLICVATVRDMMDNRILVHFDGWDDIYDYWADPTSPYIHPVGWCDQYGHDLTAPSDYPTPESFTWEKYLKETKSLAAPVRAFKQRPTCGFKRGMRLECVDKRVPRLIRVATVDDVREHQIRIHFDGWPDKYSYWVDDDSPDIHPIGWCQKTGHLLQPPLTPDDVYDFLECPTIGCKGQGHISGLKFLNHSSQKYCPYADANIDCEKTLPDRLLSPDRSPEAKEPISRQAKDYRARPRIGRPPKWLKELEASKRESTEPPEKKLKKDDFTEEPKKKVDENSPRNLLTEIEKKARNFIRGSKILPAERESRKKHSTFLYEFINTDLNPFKWTIEDVVEFVTTIPGCEINAFSFNENNIDGEALMHLSQTDLVNILNFKLGPAIKLYNAIVLLREQFCDKKVEMTMSQL